MYQFYRDENGTTWLVFDKATVEKQNALVLLDEGTDYLGYDMAFISTFAESTETFTQAQIDAMTPLVLVPLETLISLVATIGGYIDIGKLGANDAKLVQEATEIIYAATTPKDTSHAH